ncbi:MAG: DUF45 domain-containing protein [Erysipelotrichaceae bacterium]|nr:DUF45 domain-containing protein [Erysipelotrichaceae bacterium]
MMIKIGDKYFDLKIIRKNNKNIYLRIKGNTLEVTCPRWVSKDSVLSFVNSKSDWIIKSVNKADIKARGSRLGFGDTVFYLGKEYPLIVLPGRSDFRINDGKVVIHCKDGSMEEAVKVFYKANKNRLLELIRQKQDRFLAIIEDYGYDLEPDYKARLLKSMWGVNYTKKNLVVINERLIHFDEHCLEAILWHELLHFVIPNHSKRFHEILEYHMPDYKETVKSIY